MPRWSILIHNIPPQPLYLRAKVRNRLAALGAVALKNSVYVLPFSDDAVEDFQWTLTEIEEGGGTGHIVAGEFLTPATEASVISQFRAAREADYAALVEESRAARNRKDDPAAVTPKLRQRLEAIRRIDFFDAPGRKEAEAMIRTIETPTTKTAVRSGKKKAPSAATWVTRKGIKIDRMASAWLVRRFIDPKASFRFIDPAGYTKKEKEITFDMSGGEYTHVGDRCTFESLIHAFGIRDGGVRQLAEIVHDIDLKDAKYGRDDTAGVRLLIEGVIAATGRDEERLERALALFDDLHRSLGRRRRNDD